MSGSVSDAAFDGLALSYDETFTDTAIGRALRELVWLRLEQTFKPSQRVLELGCGTGEDAVWLAGRGVGVVAIDSSRQMIRIAQRKASDRDCAALLEFRCLAMEDLRSLAADNLFDGVLSNFGAVNCVRDPQALVADIAARLAPGASLVWVLMGRHAPWEWLWFLLRGQWKKAWRRLRAGGTEWRGMNVAYPTPADVEKLLFPYFAVKRISPLGLVLPPSYAAAWLDRSPILLSAMTRLEGWAQHVSFFARVSDHFMVEAVRLP